MSEKKSNKIQHPVSRLILSCVGISIMSFGIAFSVKASLGTSPISSLPYVTAEIWGMTVGTTTIITNFLMVFLQILILRRNFQLLQLLQLPMTVLFGIMIDVAGSLIQGITYSSYLQQWILCAIGIALVGLGVSLEVTANLITAAGEGLVLAICKVTPIKFGNMKVIFDVAMVCASILLGFLFLGHLSGVREGTIAAALLVGQTTKVIRIPLKKVEVVLQG